MIPRAAICSSLPDGRGHRSFDELRVGHPDLLGPAPSDFSIAGVTLDDESVVWCFSIGADTGMVSISNTDDLDPGTYKLTIARVPARSLPFQGYFRGADGSRPPEAIEVSRPLVIPTPNWRPPRAGHGDAGGRVGVDSRLCAGCRREGEVGSPSRAEAS